MVGKGNQDRVGGVDEGTVACQYIPESRMLLDGDIQQCSVHVANTVPWVRGCTLHELHDILLLSAPSVYSSI